MRFANRVAVVTGAARGIGKAIATRLASEGATVVIADVDRGAAGVVAKELEAAGRKAMACPMDVSDPSQVAATVQTVLQRFEPIDILVNNAGIVGEVIPVHGTSDAEWHRVLAVNLHGVFYCSRAVLPAMLSRKWGRIVSLASVAGKEGNPNMARSFTPEQRALLASKVPMGRLAAPEEIAAVIAFLASDDASFVTGAVYDASGGRSDY